MLPRKTKTGICTSHDVSEGSLKEYPQTSTKACKTLVNQNLITMLQIKAIEVKCGVDETTVDETGVDETGSRQTRMLPTRYINIMPDHFYAKICFIL